MVTPKLFSYIIIITLWIIAQMASPALMAQYQTTIVQGISRSQSDYNTGNLSLIRHSGFYFSQGVSLSLSKYSLTNPKIAGVDSLNDTVGYALTSEMGKTLMSFIGIGAFIRTTQENARSDAYKHFNSISSGIKFDLFLKSPLINLIITGTGYMNTLALEVERVHQRVYGYGASGGLSLHRYLTRNTALVARCDFTTTEMTTSFGGQKIMESVSGEGKLVGVNLIIDF